MNSALPLSSGIASGAAALWIGAAQVRASLYRSGMLRRRKLSAPVISIGNLSWGGTGKTPITIWLAKRLQSEGLQVSILTRGYGRSSREKVKVLPPDHSPESAGADGDEVQLYLRHLHLPVGISSSRYDAGIALERKFPVDVHLLDDGFQHLALQRNLDLVLIDASNPWGSRPGWPLLLREGFSSLRRADAVLLTRSETQSETALDKLRTAIHGYNPDAPCYEVRTKLTQLVEYESTISQIASKVAARRPLAFCALGNPYAFYSMLAGVGIDPVGKKIFADHHKYTAGDFAMLEKLARQSHANCFITTEKDIMNIPAGAAVPLPVYWAAIEAAVENEQDLIASIFEKLKLRSSHLGPPSRGEPDGRLNKGD